MNLITNNCDCDEIDTLSISDFLTVAQFLEQIENENDNHGADGRFAPGGSGPQSGGGGRSVAGAAAATLKAVNDARDFCKGKTASEVMVAVAKSHQGKEAISFALQSLLSHVSGLDQSTWHLNEIFVDHAVHNFGSAMGFTAAKSRDVLQTTVKALMSVRRGGAKVTAHSDDAVYDMLAVLDKALTDATPRFAANAYSGFTIISNFSAQPRRTTYEGKPYLVVPVIMLREAVVNGAFVAREQLIPASWNGVPVTIGHPQDDAKSEFVSANDPIALQKFGIGRIFNAHMDGDKLRAEAWIDIERANNIRPNLVSSLELGENMDVSTGYFALAHMVGGSYGGKEYDRMHSDLKPDHLALLPDESGACSWSDGCGVRANTTKAGDMKASQILTLLANALGGNSETPEAIVNTLIANEAAPFAESDREMLRAMRPEVLKSLRDTYQQENSKMTTPKKAVIAADFVKLGYDATVAARMVAAANSEQVDAAKEAADKAAADKVIADKAAADALAAKAALPATVGDLNALIAQSVGSALKSLLPTVLADQKRPELIGRVVANTAHTKEAAEKMDTATLEIIVAGIKAPVNNNFGMTDFSGRQAPNVNTSEGESKRALSLVPLTLAQHAAAKVAAANGGK